MSRLAPIVASILVLGLALVTAACGRTPPASTTPPGDPIVDGDGAPNGDAPENAGKAPPPRELLFKHGDVTIAGMYWAPAAPTEACVLFVHQLSSTRTEWKPLVDHLRGRAHLYAIDMRGHGGSTGGPKGWQAFTTSDWEAIETDVGPALDALAAEGAGRACVLVGASIGSSAVLRFAGANPDRVKALALLSPGIAYRGLNVVDAARKATDAPTVVVVSEEAGAADAAGALQGIWREAGKTALVITRAGSTAHGMKIVVDHDGIRGQLAQYLDAQIAR